MLKQILKEGRILNKIEQKHIYGGNIHHSDWLCNDFCGASRVTQQIKIARYGASRYENCPCYPV